jgi:hypothetical protein
MNKMNFIKYVSFKYKITRLKPRGSKKEVIAEGAGIVFLFLCLTAILYFIIQFLPQTIQSNMPKYLFALFSFLCLISISTSIKKYYKECFHSVEREILLVAPIKNSQVILARFSIVAIEVAFVLFIFLFPFTLANYFADHIALEIVLVTIPQIAAVSIFFSVMTHVLFGLAFILTKGRGLKTVAYSLMTLGSVGVIAIIIYSQNYKAYLINQNGIVETIFYLLLQYPKYLLGAPLDVMEVGLFTLFITVNSLCFIPIAYFITDYCYKRGFLTISLRDIEKSFYSNQISIVINKYIKNFFIRKDLLFLVRSPKLFSVYLSPILFTSVIEYKNQFASGFTLSLLVNIFALMITTVTINNLFSDDKEHQDLLFSIPFNFQELLKNRSHLVHCLSFIIAGIYITTICLLESVDIELIMYALIQIFILTFIASRVLISRIMKKSIKDSAGYRFKGEIVKPLFYFIFVWNIPLLLVFSIMHVYFRRLIEGNHVFFVQENIILILFTAIIGGMLYKSTKVKLNYGVKRK